MKPKLEWKRISLPFVLPFDFSAGYSFLHVTLEQIVQGATVRLVSDQKCFSSMQETAIFFVIFLFAMIMNKMNSWSRDRVMDNQPHDKIGRPGELAK